MEALRKLAETLWVGSLLFVAAIMAWLMLRRHDLGVSVAGSLFGAVALTGCIAGLILLIHQFWKVGFRAMRTLPFWLITVMWLFALVLGYAIHTGSAALGVRLGDVVVSWHTISMMLYLIQCVLGVLLILS
ncbi:MULTISPECIES: hypothetical protein [Leeia]|uniref:Uncharacterized protein n=1 Tax=Leeia aquatica TaxID=2725557 RepID=A0A847RS89_9NEIS|nr:hypothetical protein [Leeia aquatica]NLR74080.1 hypothetical protein [Leeia aquatica]